MKLHELQVETKCAHYSFTLTTLVHKAQLPSIGGQHTDSGVVAREHLAERLYCGVGCKLSIAWDLANYLHALLTFTTTM